LKKEIGQWGAWENLPEKWNKEREEKWEPSAYSGATLEGDNAKLI